MRAIFFRANTHASDATDAAITAAAVDHAITATIGSAVNMATAVLVPPPVTVTATAQTLPLSPTHTVPQGAHTIVEAKSEQTGSSAMKGVKPIPTMQKCVQLLSWAGRGGLAHKGIQFSILLAAALPVFLNCIKGAGQILDS
jgi:hypothetical protein